MADPTPLHLSPELLERLQQLTHPVRPRAALPPLKPPPARRSPRQYHGGRPNPQRSVRHHARHRGRAPRTSTHRDAHRRKRQQHGCRRPPGSASAGGRPVPGADVVPDADKKLADLVDLPHTLDQQPGRDAEALPGGPGDRPGDVDAHAGEPRPVAAHTREAEARRRAYTDREVQAPAAQHRQEHEQQHQQRGAAPALATD